MPNFIKTGFWERTCLNCKGYNGWLNLDELINSLFINRQPKYGSFYDSTNQTGNVGEVLTMSLNNSDSWNNGVSIVNNDEITISTPGVYNMQFSAQMVKEEGNSATHVNIWISQNGTPVPYSASQINFPSNSVYVVAAWNWFFETSAPNEYVQIHWEISSNVNNAVVIESRLPAGNIPAIPGLIVTVNQIN